MAKSKSYGGLIVLLVVIAAGAGGAWYYFRGKTDKTPEFQTAKVSRGDIVQAVTATGDLQPVVTVDIGAQVSGQIIEVLVDYNSRVKAGDVLARIDESTPKQRLNQAEADLASAEASNKLVKVNVARTRELFEKKLVSQQELDSAEAQLSQSNANLLQRKAAVENAKLDLVRTVIVAPIDGMVLDRKTDKGRTVNASMNAPTLFTLVNDLTKMQINAAVAEADIGSIAEGQQVKFTVDAFPNATFRGTVRQVRNAATANQSVVSYATIIDVGNEDLKLKPGMTANVSIIVTEKPNVICVDNGALRVRIPPELLPKAPAAAPAAATPAAGAPVIAKADGKAKSGKSAEKTGNGAAATMTDDERMRLTIEVIRATGWERGSPASPDQIEKAKVLAKEKGLDPDLVAARMATPGGRRGSGGSRDGGSRSFGGGSGRGSGFSDRGFNTTIVTRQLYRLVDPNAKEKKIEPVMVKLGVSDGFRTEVLEGLNDGDTVVKGVTVPGATPAAQASGGMQNPFQSGGRSSFGGSSGMRGPR